jgi:hypothetical protein
MLNEPNLRQYRHLPCLILRILVSFIEDISTNANLRMLKISAKGANLYDRQ